MAPKKQNFKTSTAQVTVCLLNALPSNDMPPLISVPWTPQTLVVDLVTAATQNSELPTTKSILISRQVVLPSQNDCQEALIKFFLNLPQNYGAVPTTNLQETFTLDQLRDRSKTLVVVHKEFMNDIDAIRKFPREDTLMSFALLDRMRNTRARASSAPPSEAIHSFSSIKDAYRGDHAICAGRPMDNRGPPIPLFSPELATFVHELDHLNELPDPNFESLRDARSVIEISARFYDDEAQRITALKGILEMILGPAEWEGSLSRATADSRWGAYLIGEWKNEAGLQGDPLLQASVAYRHATSSRKFRELDDAWSFPSILLGVSGTQLAIGIAIHHTHICVEQVLLTSLLPGRNLEDTVLRLARTFRALKTASENLRKAHHDATNKDTPNPLPFFPIPVSTTSTTSLPSLRFRSKILKSTIEKAEKETKKDLADPLMLGAHRPCRPEALYVANCTLPGEKEELGKQVVVKFTRRYGVEAHKVLSDARLAPKLYGAYPVQDNHFMVVMDKVEGKTVHDLDESEIRKEKKFCASLRKAVRLLHESNLVHGDLRGPNIMVSKGEAQVIDFDWAGPSGQAKYPVCMSNMPGLWDPDVAPGGVMFKKHDTYLIDRILGPSHADSDVDMGDN